MKRLILILSACVVLGLMVFAPRAVHALGQRTAVQYIRAIAADLALTPAQVDALTQQQAANYILANYPSITAAKLKECAVYWVPIKIMLRNDAMQRQTTARLVLLRQRLLTAYPSAQIDDERAVELATALLPYLYGEAQ